MSVSIPEEAKSAEKTKLATLRCGDPSALILLIISRKYCFALTGITSFILFSR